MSQGVARTIIVLAVAFFGAFFLWPIFQIVKGGFVDADGHLTFAYVRALLRDPVYLVALRNSFLVALASTALAFVIAVPLALISDRFLFPGRSLLSSLVLVPLVLPPFVDGERSMAWVADRFNGLPTTPNCGELDS